MSAFDILFAIVAIFMLSIGLILGSALMTEVDNALNKTVTVPEANYTLQRGVDTAGTYDSVFVFVFFGLMFATLIGAYIIRSSPIFLVISIILMFITIIIGGTISNVFVELTTGTYLANAVNNFPMMVQIFNMLPLILLVWGVVLAIITYSRLSSVDI